MAREWLGYYMSLDLSPPTLRHSPQSTKARSNPYLQRRLLDPQRGLLLLPSVFRRDDGVLEVSPRLVRVHAHAYMKSMCWFMLRGMLLGSFRRLHVERSDRYTTPTSIKHVYAPMAGSRV